MKKTIALTRTAVLVLAVILVSCAGRPDSRSRMDAENRSRSYQRFRTDHQISSRKELEKTGIYYDGRFFYIVISLTDSGTDSYPEWACDRFLSMLDGYGVVDLYLVSDEEFYRLALDFTLEEIVEGEYENLARVSIRERDVEKFLDRYENRP
jgi:hypothetical protein